MSEWQPIETAPKGHPFGPEILAYDSNMDSDDDIAVTNGEACRISVGSIAVVRWMLQRWSVVHDAEDYVWSDYTPTHWMPLPEPPTGV